MRTKVEYPTGSGEFILGPDTYRTIDQVPGDYPQGLQGEWDIVLIEELPEWVEYKQGKLMPRLMWVRLDFTNCLQFREYI